MNIRRHLITGQKNFIPYTSLICLFILLILPVKPVKAVNDWMNDKPIDRQSTILKPVNPILINVDGDDSYIEKESIGIPLGDIGSWTFLYDLEEGKRYHIYLIGDWISNATEPETDYDILITYPDGTSWWNTESAGIPEQITNDENHQFFVPPSTGIYRFKILNDERDSTNTEAAIFMLLEHIDENTWYSCSLEGRDESTDEEVLFSGWGYEFNTAAPRIRVFVSVPDFLDMYEVRLYMMTNQEAEKGYQIDGIGVPTGDLLLSFSGEYGGYSTFAIGDRNIEAMDSCEASGRDMEFVFDTPNMPNGTSDIFYYVSLIAEHGIGAVEFYIQTDFNSPEITLIDSQEFGFESKKTTITASVLDEGEVQRVWVEHEVDGEGGEEIELAFDGEYWIESFPFFEAGDLVEYEVHATDVFGNENVLDSELKIKREASIVCTLVDSNLIGNEIAEVKGSSSLKATPLMITFTNGASSSSYDIVTDSDGNFEFEFTPDTLGQWTVYTEFEGDDETFNSQSDPVTFTRKSIPTQITNSLSLSKVKLDKPIRVSGSVSPRVANLPIEVMFVTPFTMFTETTYTDDKGAYSCSIEPTETGTWSVLTSVGDGFLYEKTQSSLMDFEVTPLTILDKVENIYIMLINPPYMYGTLGFLGISFSAVLYVKRDAIAPHLPKFLTGKLGNSKKKKKKKGGAQRYKRSK
jgi:hypothetical protein